MMSLSALKNHHYSRSGWAASKQLSTERNETLYTIKLKSIPMNSVQLHLLTNHLPSIGQIIGLLVLITGLIKASRTIQSTGVWIILASALMILPVSRSGELAEDQIENIAGISETVIESHEEAGEKAWVMTVANGVIALFWLVISKKKEKLLPITSGILVFSSAAAVILVILASHQGGLIRHPELNNTVQTNPSTVVDGEGEADGH
jgi:hypothetical protein